MKKILLFLILIPAHLFAADELINENELFSGSETVVENKIQDNSLKNIQDKKSVSVSGNIKSAVLYSKIDQSSQDSLIDKMIERDSLVPYIVGDLLFDARLPGGSKGFGYFELEHNASVDEEKTGQKQTTCSTKELFVDFNINRYVYFRTGKQVLSWGQCYLWNPTDMINIENKSFISKLEAREGTYGVKMHVPFGTAANIYGFAGMDNVSAGEDVAGAGKFEFLIKGTEMAFSAWGKKSYKPVYGYDFSGRMLGIDVKGEASYSHGSNKNRITDDETSLLITKDENRNVFKASINFGRDFDFGEKSDRLNVSIEMFYNGDGYRENPFSDHRDTYLYSDPITFKYNGNQFTDFVGDRKTYIIGKGLYEPNYLSQYYAAIFITLKEFILSDMTLSLNGISNIQQNSYIVSSSLSYTNINDFTAGATVNGYLGDKDGEYRALNRVYFDVLVTAGILF